MFSSYSCSVLFPVWSSAVAFHCEDAQGGLVVLQCPFNSRWVSSIFVKLSSVQDWATEAFYTSDSKHRELFCWQDDWKRRRGKKKVSTMRIQKSRGSVRNRIHAFWQWFFLVLWEWQIILVFPQCSSAELALHNSVRVVMGFVIAGIKYGGGIKSASTSKLIQMLIFPEKRRSET